MEGQIKISSAMVSPALRVLRKYDYAVPESSGDALIVRELLEPALCPPAGARRCSRAAVACPETRP